MNSKTYITKNIGYPVKKIARKGFDVNKRTIMFIFTLLLAACTNETDEQIVETTSSSKNALQLHAVFINEKNEIIGKAVISEAKQGVLITLNASKLPPGSHGFHIHEKGVCEPEKQFESAGAHFNPFQKKHGTLNPEGPHAGDLPNIIVANDGSVNQQILAPLVTLKENKRHSLLKPEGTALIIHEKPDDYKTDPAGNAGKRIACAVMKKT